MAARNIRFSTVLLILCCAILLISGQGFTTPVFAEAAKDSSQTVTSTSAAGTVVTLGTYGDFSAMKKQGLDYALSSAKKKIDRYLSARSAIIIDGHSEATLFARNPDTPRQPASTIKVLTAMIALKSLDSNETIPVSRKAARQPSSKMYLDQRKQYNADDLINAVLLSSANDASVALAEKIGGSEKIFAKMMTLSAKLWGASQTVCKTATGLTAKGQQSTSRDLAMIFNHAMKDADFAARMKLRKAQTTEGKFLRNHNKALWRVPGTEGGKTGYTNAARQTYVGKFKRGDDEIVIAILGSERMWNDVEHLVEYGFRKKQYLTAQRDEGWALRLAEAERSGDP